MLRNTLKLLVPLKAGTFLPEDPKTSSTPHACAKGKAISFVASTKKG